jgi:hypothetical protein
MAKQLHIAIMTGHIEAILIPLRQIQPEEVLLVASTSMAKDLNRYQNLLKNNLNANTVIKCRDGLDDNEPMAIGDFAMQLAEELIQRPDYEELAITFHCTGGTKLMTLLFQEALRCCDAQLLYVDSKAGKIYHLGNSLKPSEFTSQAVESVLSSKLYFEANGKRIRAASSDDADWLERAKSRKNVSKSLAIQTAQSGFFVGALNHLVHGGDKTLRLLQKDPAKPRQLKLHANVLRSLNEAPRTNERTILKDCAALGLIGLNDDKQKDIYFNSLEAAQYLGGQWLEEYTWHCMQDAGLKDVACSLPISDEEGRTEDVRNELDCVAVHENRMLILECKTGRMGLEEGKDQDILHKLYSITEQSAGLLGTKVLVLARDFDNNDQKKTNLKRAKIMNVHIVAPADLPNLKQWISNWKMTGKFGA